MRGLKLKRFIIPLTCLMVTFLAVFIYEGQSSATDVSDVEQYTNGWLILEGKLIHGPYVVNIINGAININEKRIEKPIKFSISVAVEPSIVAKHQVLETFYTVFPLWVAEEGVEKARERALKFMQAQPLVKEAYFYSDSHLRVLFQGEKHEELVNLSVHYEQKLSPEQVRAQYLESQTKALKYWLTNGSLVILQQGVLMATPPLEGAAMLKQLQEIATSGADADTKTTAIGKIIPDTAIAKIIAERLMQD